MKDKGKTAAWRTMMFSSVTLGQQSLRPGHVTRIAGVTTQPLPAVDVVSKVVKIKLVRHICGLTTL